MKPKRSFMTKDFAISKESHSEGWTMPYMHYHDSYEIYILESGSRIVTIGDNEYKVGAHDVTLFNKNIPHTSRGDTPFAGICIHLLDRFTDFYFTKEAKKHLLKCFNYTVIHLSDNEFQIIKSIADNFVVKADNNFMKLAQIADLLSAAAKRSEEYMPSQKQNPVSKASRIIQYVNDNYIFINNINDITERFGVSESYIFKIFKQEFNTTPKKYLYSLKLNNACHWLENRNATIKTIAFDSGFECYEYFIRLFKELFNCTPSEYKRRHKGIGGT